MIRAPAGLLGQPSGHRDRIAGRAPTARESDLVLVSLDPDQHRPDLRRADRVAPVPGPSAPGTRSRPDGSPPGPGIPRAGSSIGRRSSASLQPCHGPGGRGTRRTDQDFQDDAEAQFLVGLVSLQPVRVAGTVAAQGHPCRLGRRLVRSAPDREAGMRIAVLRLRDGIGSGIAAIGPPGVPAPFAARCPPCDRDPARSGPCSPGNRPRTARSNPRLARTPARRSGCFPARHRARHGGGACRGTGPRTPTGPPSAGRPRSIARTGRPSRARRPSPGGPAAFPCPGGPSDPRACPIR